MAEVKVDGTKELSARLKKINKTATNEIEQALIDGALMIERDYKLNVNQARLVDTGRWIGSITHKDDNFGTNTPAVQIGSTIKDPPYPVFHEFGTSKFPATPTLWPAFTGNKQKIRKKLASAFKKGCGL